jgi:hypothetical protein
MAAAHHAVNVRHASNVSVFARCKQSTAARAGDASFTTSAAPMSASVNKKAVERVGP